MSTSNNHGFNTLFNSQLPKREQRALLRRIAIAACCGVLALILILSISMAIYTAVSGPNDPGKDPLKDKEITYTDKTFTVDDTKFGSLVLVDADHPYTSDREPDLATIPTKTPACFGENKKMDSDAVAKLTPMLDAQYAATNTSIMTRFAYLTDLSTTETAYLYEAHALKTGFVVELRVKSDTGNIQLNASDYATAFNWFKENAHKYGFIIEPLDNDRTVLYRYVGVAHATYIYKYNVQKPDATIGLKEYVEALPQRGQANPLSVEGADGNEYLVYYTAVTADTTIKVPTNCEYIVSGDNMGGVIVTVNKSAPITPEVESESESESVSDTTPASGDEA